MGRILVALPMAREFALLAEALSRHSAPHEYEAGRLKTLYFPKLDLHLFRAGQGKAEYALTTGHVLDRLGGVELFICAGSAGAISEEVPAGSLVVSTETVEHDFKSSHPRAVVPVFPGSEKWIGILMGRLAKDAFPSPVFFGKIASGDEDITSEVRKNALRELTGCLCVAWEGAGGARSAYLMETPYLEIRAVTDFADAGARRDFFKNLEDGMKKIAALILLLLENEVRDPAPQKNP
ncbi:MAG: 5'-methylthioadenosine/S-adenosylhomocysteine nucleosidase [Spirochaetia bacterium]|nr:5'-methylthioadenosine/S-adenosylhomocysteine nucleosidase [Spirochaetia bacterium]